MDGWLNRRKSQLKMIMETKLEGLEVVLNLYDNQFYQVDALLRFQTVGLRWVDHR